MKGRKKAGILCIVLAAVLGIACFWFFRMKCDSGAGREETGYQATERSQELQALLREKIEVGAVQTETDSYGAVVKTAPVKLPDYSVLLFLSVDRANAEAESPEQYEELMLEEASQKLSDFLELEPALSWEEREISLTFFAGEEQEKTDEELQEMFRQKALEDEMAQTAMLLMMAADGEAVETAEAAEGIEAVEGIEAAGKDSGKEEQK